MGGMLVFLHLRKQSTQLAALICSADFCVHLVKSKCLGGGVFLQKLTAAINYCWWANIPTVTLQCTLPYSIFWEYVFYCNLIVAVLFMCYALTSNSVSMLSLKSITTLCTLKKVPVPAIMTFCVFIVTKFVVLLRK
jgi:hypothetical protein